MKLYRNASLWASTTDLVIKTFPGNASETDCMLYFGRSIAIGTQNSAGFVHLLMCTIDSKLKKLACWLKI